MILRVDAAHACQPSPYMHGLGLGNNGCVLRKAVCEWQGSMLQNRTPAAVHVLLVVTHQSLFLGRAESD